MEKKESPKEKISPKDNFISSKKEGASLAKVTGLSSRAFSIIKFILGICLLPFVYGTTLSFLNEFYLIEKQLQNAFWSGLITLLLIYLFAWEPTIIYLKGQRLLEIIFTFFRPLVKVAPYLLPIYTILLFLALGLITFIFQAKGPFSFMIFLIGFSVGLHLVFSAKSIRTKQNDFLKANYIFGFSLVYMIHLLLLSFCFNLIFEIFSFVNFSNNSFQIGKGIFYSLLKQLFLQ